MNCFLKNKIQSIYESKFEFSIKMKKVALIACVDAKYGFARGGTIPWKSKMDIEFFQDTTSYGKNSVIFGRNTWRTLPGPLKNRTNIVVSKTAIPKVHTTDSVTAAIQLSKHLGHDTTFICGGLGIYREALQLGVDEIYLTQIHRDYNCDMFLPTIDNRYHEVFCKTFDNTTFTKLTTHDPHFIRCDEIPYLNLLEKCVSAAPRQTRNSVCHSVFGEHLQFDLQRGFPLLTTKKMQLQHIFHELMFFVRGQTNTNLLADAGVNIWAANTSAEFLRAQRLPYPQGFMGPMYGYQWRHFGQPYMQLGGGVDQLANLIESLRTDPHSRRHVMTSFNPAQVTEGVLWPCHGLCIQFYVENGLLSCAMTQRSADVFLGLPYNIASYALLTHMVAAAVDLQPGTLHVFLGDVHLYETHREQAIRQILRTPTRFPRLHLNTSNTIEGYRFEDVTLTGYRPHPAIRAAMVA